VRVTECYGGAQSLSTGERSGQLFHAPSRNSAHFGLKENKLSV